MLNIIEYNPYRVLGVFSNSPKREQVANKAKIQAFFRVKKSMQFPLDLKDVLPTIERTQEVVDKADSNLVLQEEQIKYAQFWFIKKTPIDEIAFNHLLSGKMDEAIGIWGKSFNTSSLQNLFTCEVIKGNYLEAINKYALPLYRDHVNEFIALITENCNLSSSDLIKNVVDTFQSEGVDLGIISSVNDVSWKGYIDSKRISPLTTALESAVTKAKESRGKGPISRYKAGNKLIIDTKSTLSELKALVGKNNTTYQLIADKIAQEALQCSIDYYNESKADDKPIKALPICEYACSIAVGTAAKQRCEQNRDVLKEAVDNMPPQECAKESKEIDNLLKWIRNQKRTSENALELLRKARIPLRNIKEILGKTNEYYLETSSLIGNIALSYVIDDVNDAQKEEEDPFAHLFGNSYGVYDFLNQDRRLNKAKKIKSALRSAWQTILYIDLLDKTSDFDKNRFQPNKKTLRSIISDVKGFDYPDGNYILKGCCNGLSADKKFFWSETEYYTSCSSSSDYRSYLKEFPGGKYVDEAKQKIEEIAARDRKLYWIIGIVAAAIVLFLIVMSINATNKNSYTYDDEEESTEYYVDTESDYDSSSDYEYADSAAVDTAVADYQEFEEYVEK